MLVISRKCGEAFHIGDDIHITITEISGDKVKIGITAPRTMSILRDELLQIIDSNKAAMATSSSAAHLLAARLVKQKDAGTKL